MERNHFLVRFHFPPKILPLAVVSPAIDVSLDVAEQLVAHWDVKSALCLSAKLTHDSTWRLQTEAVYLMPG